MTLAGFDGDPGRRAARWVAPAILCAGGLCALAGAAWLYVESELGTLLRPETEPPADVTFGTPDAEATRTETEHPAEVKNLVPAALAVLGTILVSLGLVFVLERAGVLWTAAGRRQDGEERGPHRLSPKTESGAAPPIGGGQAPVPAPEGAAGARAAPPVGSGPHGVEPDDRHDLLTGGAPDRGAPDAAPDRGDSEAVSARTADAARETADEPESASPAPTTAAARGVEEPPPPEEPQPGDLLAAWDDYRRDGDGHFNRRGLQEVLDDLGLAATVSGGERIGARGAVLVVETPSGAPDFYVLPSFNKSPRAVADWFDDNGDGALTGRTQRLIRLARGRWMETEAGAGSGNFEVIGKGEVA